MSHQGVGKDNSGNREKGDKQKETNKTDQRYRKGQQET